MTSCCGSGPASPGPTVQAQSLTTDLTGNRRNLILDRAEAAAALASYALLGFLKPDVALEAIGQHLAVVRILCEAAA